MRNELKRCNNIGSISSLQYLAQIAIVDHATDIDTVASICSLNTSLSINCKAALFFFEALGLLVIDEARQIFATPYGRALRVLSQDEFTTRLAEAVLGFLLESGQINLEAVTYDNQNNVCKIRKSGFPLSSAVFRNFLIDARALIEVCSGTYELHRSYEDLFEKQIKSNRKKLTLESLLEKQRRQEEQGRLAEEFVVEFEKRRLLWGAASDHVKQISDFDVTAGYDVLSFDDNSFLEYNRFIEVKSFHSRPQFYWSSNELKAATEYGDRYYLYLVDMDRYLMPNYEPLIIQNPSGCIMQSEDWLVEPSSYKITMI